MTKIYRIILAVAMLVLSACGKDLEFDGNLSLSNESVLMPSEEAWHVVAVYANSSWTARLSEQVDWVNIDVESADAGLGRILVTCAANHGLKRSVDLIVTDGIYEDIMRVEQAAGVSSPEFSFVKTSLEVSGDKATIMTGFSTNLEYDLDRVVAKVVDTAGSQVDWISAIVVEKDRVYFNVSRTESDRVAVLNLSLTDSDGNVYETSLSVTQKK